MPQVETAPPPNGQEVQARHPAPGHGGQAAALDNETDAAVTLRLVEEQQIEVFCDELRSPCIRLPDDPVEPVWPLYHQRVRSWIAELFHSKKSRFIADRDIATVLRVLEGRAWKVPRRAPTTDPTWQRVERDPVALALIIYANAQGEFEGMTRDLFVKLFDTSIQDRLRMASLALKFPTNTQVFSRRVGDIKAVLHEIGIDIIIDRREAGSFCSLKIRQGVFVREPDGIRVIPTVKASGTSPFPAGTLRPADANEAMKEPPKDMETILASIRTIREEQL